MLLLGFFFSKFGVALLDKTFVPSFQFGFGK